MGAQYRIVLYSRAGVVVSEITDYLGLGFSNGVNRVGLLKMTLRGNHKVRPLLERNMTVEVYRTRLDLGIPEYREWVGLLRGVRRSYQNKLHRIELIAQEAKVLLSWRHILWPAGMEWQSKYTSRPAETIAKTMVDWNLGPNARAEWGRKRNGMYPGVSLTPDLGRGNTLNWFCAWDNLMESLQDLAGVGGGDFDLTVPEGTPNTYSFQWYPGQRGTNRASSVIFSLEWGNMTNPTYLDDARDLKTVVAVLGQGQEEDRESLIVTGDLWSAVDDIEGKVDAGDVEPGQTSVLRDRGQAALKKTQGTQAFEFEIIQTKSSAYALHYTWGDLVTGIYEDVEAVRKITQVTIQHERDGEEVIDLELSHV